MVPFELKPDYHNRSWLTVRFELNHDEVGSTAVATSRIAPDIVELFATLGLPEPAPVPLLIVEHQIAQSSTPARHRTVTATTNEPTTSSTSNCSSTTTHLISQCSMRSPDDSSPLVAVCRGLRTSGSGRAGPTSIARPPTASTFSSPSMMPQPGPTISSPPPRKQPTDELRSEDHVGGERDDRWLAT